MEQPERLFFEVAHNLQRAPLCDYLQHGYETRDLFEAALEKLVQRWHDRIGEQIDKRNDFLRLRFHDTPGGLPDEAWLPRYLLTSTEMPDYLVEPEKTEYDELEEELDRIFAFDP